jgi:hypothetical protein
MITFRRLVPTINAPARQLQVPRYWRLVAAIALVVSFAATMMAGGADPAAAAPVTVARAARAGPAGWPAFGNSCNNRYTWCDMTMTNYVTYPVLGIPDEIDQITVRITVDPGAVTSRIGWTVTRSPQYDYLTDLHLQAYVLCYGNQVCHSETVDIARAGSGTFYISSPISLRGKSVAHAISLNSFCADCVKGMNDLSAGQRTRYAACQKSSNICRYYR